MLGAGGVARSRTLTNILSRRGSSRPNDSRAQSQLRSGMGSDEAGKQADLVMRMNEMMTEVLRAHVAAINEVADARHAQVCHTLDRSSTSARLQRPRAHASTLIMACVRVRCAGSCSRQ